MKSDNQQSLLATAYHEAGHAVVAHALGRLVGKVSIVPGKSQLGDARLGTCQLQKGRSRSSRNELQDEVQILLGGMVAESRLTGRYCPQSASMDLRMAERLLTTRAEDEASIRKRFRRLLDKTENILDEPAHAKALQLIANELVQRQSISGRAVRHFFQQAEQQTG